MGLQKRLNEQNKHVWTDNPSRLRFIACILCHQAGGQKFTSPLKKIKDPITGDEVYFHVKGCPQ